MLAVIMSEILYVYFYICLCAVSMVFWCVWLVQLAPFRLPQEPKWHWFD
jgi:hypothetical protein